MKKNEDKKETKINEMVGINREEQEYEDRKRGGQGEGRG